MTASGFEAVLKLLSPLWVVGWVAFILWTLKAQLRADGYVPDESVPMFIGRCSSYAAMGFLAYALASIVLGGAFVLCAKLLLWSFTGSQFLPP